MKYVVDFDDLCDATVGTLDVLARLKDANPSLKVCLFTIPKRTSPATIARVKELNESGTWVVMAPHGWRHTRGECLSWNVEEAVDKIKRARDMGIDGPAFRAPAWLLDTTIYEACSIEGVTVCDHAEFRMPYPNSRVYTYNHKDGHEPQVRGIHGHLTHVADNYIEAMLEDGRLKFHQKAEFAWPWNVAVPNPMADDEEDPA